MKLGRKQPSETPPSAPGPSGIQETADTVLKAFRSAQSQLRSESEALRAGQDELATHRKELEKQHAELEQQHTELGKLRKELKLLNFLNQMKLIWF